MGTLAICGLVTVIAGFFVSFGSMDFRGAIYGYFLMFAGTIIFFIGAGGFLLALLS